MIGWCVRTNNIFASKQDVTVENEIKANFYGFLLLFKYIWTKYIECLFIYLHVLLTFCTHLVEIV